jgi:hypothetical protein
MPPSTSATELQYPANFVSTATKFVARSIALVAVIEGAGGCDGRGLAADTIRAMAKESPIVARVFFMSVIFLVNVEACHPLLGARL